MSSIVTIREYARLTTNEVPSSLDQATISQSAFNWLLDRNFELENNGKPIVQIESRSRLQLKNYVGVVETPCGTVIEILPKHIDEADTTESARHLLIKMIAGALNLPTKEYGPTQISTFKASLHEWVIRQFLDAVNRIVKRGVRREYKRVEEEEKFLRGQLISSRQLKQPPHRLHLFHVSYDVFSNDCPENRLIRSCLDRVLKVTRVFENMRLARELSFYFHEVPHSTSIDLDFRQWIKRRLTAHYAPARPWCSLILEELNPISVAGKWRGLSLLFPMERLFESYVTSRLKQKLLPRSRLVAQSTQQYLCEHKEKPLFQLRPDIIISLDDKRWVLDAKWKILDGGLADSKNKYGLKQSDFYQLFAYGQRYLDGEGELFLIYPKNNNFVEPLEPFEFSSKLRLWVCPFDLSEGCLIDDVSNLPLASEHPLQRVRAV